MQNKVSKTPQEKLNKMFQMLENGHSVREISEVLGMGQTTIRDNIKKTGWERSFESVPSSIDAGGKNSALYKKLLQAKEDLKNPPKWYEFSFTGTLRLMDRQIIEVFKELEIDFETIDKSKLISQMEKANEEGLLSVMIEKGYYVEDIIKIESVDKIL